MGQWVALSAAADPKAAWAKAGAEERFFNSTGLGVTAVILLAYASSGVVFGYLPMFLPDGFIWLQGPAAWLGAVGAAVLGLGWASHLVQRHWSSASSAACATFRQLCYVAAATCACVVVLVQLFGTQPMPRWSGLAPASEWLLSPLPWVWRELLPLASDRVTGKLFLAGGVAFGLSLLFLKGIKSPRGFIFFFGMAACAAGVYFLGDAAFDYAAARGLPGVSANYPKELQANPGRYNAWNFLSWLGALAFLAYGALFISVAFVIQDRDIEAKAARP